jgi:hypothetical protein
MRIRVNGEEYDAWEDVPEEARRLLGKALPDEDHDGVPDVFEDAAGPDHHAESAHFVATQRTRVTRVPGSATRPGFSFRMTTSDVHVEPPDPDELGREWSTPLEPMRSVDRPILLNGVEVGADGQPLRKRKRWRRRHHGTAD